MVFITTFKKPTEMADSIVDIEAKVTWYVFIRKVY